MAKSRILVGETAVSQTSDHAEQACCRIGCTNVNTVHEKQLEEEPMQHITYKTINLSP